MRGSILVYLLMLVKQVTKRTSTCEYVRDDERGIPISSLRAPRFHHKVRLASKELLINDGHTNDSISNN